jgi:isopenicillin-N N-acyltransferase like protein
VTPPTIQTIRVAGSHRQVGELLGEAGAEAVRSAVAEAWANLPAGRTRSDQLTLAAEYRNVTQASLPWLVDELDGLAAGAGIDPSEVFAWSIEELWYEPRSPVNAGRCSDLVAGPSATADGHLLVGHNNDLHPDEEDHIVAIEKQVDGDPVVFQLGGIPWLSVGWSSAGLSLTGNELSPNDERIGISRSHQVVEMLRAQSLSEMVSMALRSDRASSYNNVLTSADGGVANIEGSATDAEVTGLDDRGHLVHTNHYVCDRMRPFEGDPAYARRSEVRYRRGRALLGAEAPGSITNGRMRALLADHEGAPDSLCRHAEGDGTGKTVFWCVADVTDGVIRYGRGNPCDSIEQTYRFESWPVSS